MPAIRTYMVTCPCCATILVVNRDTGEITETRKPLVEKPSGDRFADALQAQKEHKKKLGSLFADSVTGLSKKDEERRRQFEESLKKAREQGDSVEPEIRDIDL